MAHGRRVSSSSDGKILYSGHPSDLGLRAALAKLDERLADSSQ
jgi:hypothetical protein